MLGITNNPQLILILVILMLTVVGMFMERAATILILTPILLPVIKSIGIDPVHFGMIIRTVVTMGNCTPPVGLSMYTVNSVIDCSLGEYTKEMVPWLSTFLIAMAILAFFPAPFMWLKACCIKRHGQQLGGERPLRARQQEALAEGKASIVRWNLKESRCQGEKPWRANS